MHGLRNIGVRTQVAVLVGLAMSAVVTVLSGLSAYTLRQNLNAALETQTHAMVEALQRKGTAIAHNVAFTSSRAIVTGNFTFLMEVVNTTVSADKEMLYGIIMDKDRRALVHSVPSLANSELSGPADLFAARQEAPATQRLMADGVEVMEAIAPIMVASKLWGWVRFGMPMTALHEQIARVEAAAQENIARVTTTSLVAAAILLLCGTIAGASTASSLLRPLATLVRGADEIREGHVDQEVAVEGSPEFRSLASAFNAMAAAVKHRETALEGALDAATEANRLKSEFLANVSHELRTPLNAIINVPAALIRDYEGILLWHCPGCGAEFEPEAGSQQTAEACPVCQTTMALQERAVFRGDANEHRRFLQRTMQAAQHLLSVVNDILDLSKLEAGKMTVSTSDVKIAETFAAVKETLDVLAESKGVRLSWPAVDPEAEVHGDALKLSQVVVNLVGNALKFTPAGGQVSVSLSEDADTTTFMVRDSGIGIAQNKLEVIFESFRQIDGSNTRSQGGTGLGLSISRKLIELQGGKMWVESELGRGSCFFFTLPKRAPQQVQASEAEMAQRFVGRVLVVDDDVTQLAVAQRVLTDAGWVVRALHDPKQIDEALQQDPVDVIVLDIMMPEVSGITVLKRLAGTPLPVVVSTAYHANKELVTGLGATWLAKPWQADDLLRQLSDAVQATRDANVTGKNA